MKSYSRFITILAGLALAASTVLAQIPQINKIGDEESVSSSNMERPNVTTDSKAQPHFVCDSPGGDTRFSKYSKINGKWYGGIFAVGSKGGRYDASRLYVGQISIDAKDRAWVSCKFGCKEFGNMLGQGIWLFRDVSTNPRPPEQFFRHVNVYKGMGAVSIDSKYPDQGVVMGTFGNFNVLDQAGKTLKSGSINAGHGGEKVRSTIASYAPRFPTVKEEKLTYPDGIWHTAMNGSHAVSSSYQNSERHKAGLGYVTWASYGSFPEMGGDFLHPGISTDSTDPRYCYIGQVFHGGLRLNIWDGTRMLFNPDSPKLVSANASMEVRHAVAITPAPANTPGAFIFWLASGRIKMVYVSKKGQLGDIVDITAGRSPAATTDRYGNIHLVYYNGGIKYRKILVSTLQGTAPEGLVTDRTPQFIWSNIRAARYTVEVFKDGVKLTNATVSATTWTPRVPFAAGVYSWRVKEGWLAGSEKPSASLAFVIPPVTPDPLSPDTRATSAYTPTLKWGGIDGAANQFTVQLFKNGGTTPIGSFNTSGNLKERVGSVAWTNTLGAGYYTWYVKANRILRGYTISSDWSDGMTFQVRVPGPTALTKPLANTTFNPGLSTITGVWTSAEGAAGYTLKVLYNGEFLETYSTGNTNVPMTRIFQPGYHTLLVQPRNDAGNGAWSDTVTLLIRRYMRPIDTSVLDQAPARLTWTRTKDATRYLSKLSKRNPTTKLYQVVGEKWITQSAFGEAPLWKPTYAFVPGAYRWSVTDYFGAKQGYTSVSYFRITGP